MKFDWDDRKNATNLRKHGIDFETATVVFDDPQQVLLFDRIVDGEERWQTIGLVDGVYLLIVVHTCEGDYEECYRLISARKAKPHERRKYYEGL